MTTAPKSPNQDIDDAISDMMKTLKRSTEPTEVKLKIINTAIAWEKVKNNINDNPSAPLDPNTF